MKFINVTERVPALGDYYYCKVDTKQDCIVKTVVEFSKFPNGNYDWDLENTVYSDEFGEESEVIEWLDENYEEPMIKAEYETENKDHALSKSLEVFEQYFTDGGHFYGNGIYEAIELLKKATK